MRKILLFALILASTMLHAQLPQVILTKTKKVIAFDENYDGTIYKDTWKKKSIVVDEKSGSYEAKLRYNIYSDRIEVKDASGLQSLVKSAPIHVKIDDDYYYYCEFKTRRERPKKGYFVLVHLADDFKIYKKYDLDIKQPNDNTNFNTEQGKPGIIKLVTTYYLEEHNTIVELPLKKKEMLALFEAKHNELEKFFKNEKIKLRKEEDLIKFVSHFNSLTGTSRQRGLLSNLTPR